MNESEFNTFSSLCLLHNDYNFESGSIESQLDSANILQLSKSAFIVLWHWNSILFENIRSQEVSRSRTSPLLMRNKKLTQSWNICFGNAEIFPPSVDQFFFIAEILVGFMNIHCEQIPFRWEAPVLILNDKSDTETFSCELKLINKKRIELYNKETRRQSNCRTKKQVEGPARIEDSGSVGSSWSK